MNNKKFYRSSIRLIVIGIIGSLLAIYVCLCPLIAMPLYNLVLFVPDKKSYDVEKEIQSIKTLLKVNWEDVYFSSPKGARLHGWLFSLPGDKPITLLSHGNGGNLIYRLPMAFNLLNNGVSVFLYDYEGYGTSEGSPSIENICADGVAAYDYLYKEKKYSANQIIGYGESLGTAVTCYISSQRQFSKIILQAPFVSLIRTAGDRLPWLKLYPDFLFPKPRLNNLEVLSKTHSPVLIIHGKQDSILSYHYSEELMKKALSPVQLLLLPHANHNDIGVVDGDLFFPTLKSFLKP